MAEINNVIAEASQDLQTIEDFVNLPAGSDVRPRLLPSVNVGTLAGARQAIFEAGGLPATPFATKALMTASALVDGDYAMVTDDTDIANNALYLKTAGAWVKSKYDFDAKVKDYALKNGFARLSFAYYAGTQGVTFNTITNTLTFSHLTFVNTASTSATIAIPSPVNIVFGAANDYRIEFNQSTTQFRAVLASSARESGWLICAYATRTGMSFYSSDFKDYLVDGVNPNAISETAKNGVLLTDKATTININTATGKLQTVANARIIANSNNYLVPESSVNLPTALGAYRVEYNPTLNVFEINIGSAPLVANNVFFARLVVPLANTYELYGVDKYSVNGVPVEKGGQAKTGRMIALIPNELDFNFESKTITVANNRVRVVYGDSSDLLPAQIINISNGYNDLWVRLVYNVATKGFSTKTLVTSLVGNEIAVAYIKVNDKQVIDIPYYTVLGKEPSGSTKNDMATAKYQVPYGDVSFLNLAEQASLLPTYTATNKNVPAFYALYDALVTAYPSYVKMTVIGTDKDGNEIRQYRFNAPKVPVTAVSSVQRPKLLLVAGVHGEHAGTYNLYNTMRIICEDWRTSPQLETLRWGTDIVTVPLATPSAFIQDTRKNSNGVDIARNFEVGWTTSDPSSDTYGGVSALSEPESIALNSVMLAHRDALMFASLHSFTAFTTPDMPNGVSCWDVNTTEFGNNLGKALVTNLTIAAKKRYAWINQGDDVWIGYSTVTAPPASEGVQAMRVHGIQGGTFEINGKLYWEVGNPSLSVAATTLAAECLLNWMLINLKHAPDFYNAKISL